MTHSVEFESVAHVDDESQKFSFDGEGVTVLAFFPGAFTSVCTEEMCSFRDSIAEFEKLDAEVIGISVDTPFSLGEFAYKNNLNFPLVSDPENKIAEQYGVKGEMPDLGYTVCERAVFVVKDGEVVYKEIMDDIGNLPDMDKLKQELQEL